MKSFKLKLKVIEFTKWLIISFIALLISNYLVTKLAITNVFLITFFTALFVSVVIQIFRSHNHQEFNFRWFVFYFLLYATFIWIVNEYIFAEIIFQKSIFLSFITSILIAGVILLIEKINLRYRTLPWISLVFVLLIIVGNLGYIQQMTQITLIPQFRNDSSALSEDKLVCPSTVLSLPVRELSPLVLNTLIKTDVWRIEKNFDTCYSGNYRGQYTERMYCDNMIVSRWDKSSLGSINYRWYAAVTTEWVVESFQGEHVYVLESISCENGKKVTVDKETRNYYVHVARDGTEIRVE